LDRELFNSFKGHHLAHKRSNMKCRRVQKKLSIYQDRELKPLEQEEVGRHLQGCRACREEYEKLERVWQTLGGMEELRPDPWFYRQLVTKMKEPRKRGLFPSLQHVFQFVGAPAIASIILVIGLVAGSYLGSKLAERNRFRFQSVSVGDSQSSVFASMRVFDPTPPGTFAEGYLRMASYEERGSR
jgi:predicted anti-sigma-YlaC factor YlaD